MVSYFNINIIFNSLIFCISLIFIDRKVTDMLFRKRFYSIMNYPENNRVTIKDIICVFVIITVCLLIKLTNVSITVIIELNGAIVSFFFIYLIPIGLHIKCIYFTDR